MIFAVSLTHPYFLVVPVYSNTLRFARRNRAADTKEIQDSLRPWDFPGEYGLSLPGARWSRCPSLVEADLSTNRVVERHLKWKSFFREKVEVVVVVVVFLIFSFLFFSSSCHLFYPGSGVCLQILRHLKTLKRHRVLLFFKTDLLSQGLYLNGTGTAVPLAVAVALAKEAGLDH